MGLGSYWEIIIHPSDCVELFADFLMERTSCAIEYLDTTSPFALHYDEASWHTPKAFTHLSPSLFQHINATQPTQLVLRIESSTPFETNKEAGKPDSEAVSESASPVIASVAKQPSKIDSESMDCHADKSARNDNKTESRSLQNLESKTDSEPTPAERHALSAIESSFSSEQSSEQALKASSGWGIVKGEGATSPNSSPSPLDEKNTKINEVSKTLEAKAGDSKAIDSESERQTESARVGDSEKRDLESEMIKLQEAKVKDSKSLENDPTTKRSALISQTLGGAAEFTSASQDRACEPTPANSEAENRPLESSLKHDTQSASASFRSEAKLHSAAATKQEQSDNSEEQWRDRAARSAVAGHSESDNSEDIILSCLRYAATLTDTLALDKPVTFCYHIERKANRDWIKAYEDSITPVVCGRFYIHPPWCAPHADMPPLDSQINACSLQNLESQILDSNAPNFHALESCALDSQPIESRLESQSSLTNSLLPIAINPALAFGSGHHASTRMCLELLGELELEGRAVLDVGCGSGILGIAASKLGAMVEACDTDEFALQETRKNFETNATALEASWLGSINHSRAHYDVIIANIIAFVITLLHDDFAAHLKKGGILILSGILDEYKSDIMRTFSDFTLLEARSTEGWSALKLTL